MGQLKDRAPFVLIAYAILAAALVVGAYRIETTVNQVQELANENRESTCRFVLDLQQRYDATQRYIRDVLAGRRALIPGVSLADLQRTQTSRQQTLESFAKLHCEE